MTGCRWVSCDSAVDERDAVELFGGVAAPAAGSARTLLVLGYFTGLAVWTSGSLVQPHTIDEADVKNLPGALPAARTAAGNDTAIWREFDVK